MAVPSAQRGWRGVSRWTGIGVLLVIGGLYLLVSRFNVVGPSWLVLLIIVILLVPTTMAHRRGNHRLTRSLVFLSMGVVTGAVAASAMLLVTQLPTSSSQTAPVLLRDAALIWIANVLTFALWYWEIDDGGPVRRHAKQYRSADFVFPQLTLQHDADPHWSPGFVDYLFLAFNTSTAFSPTDTLVLSRRAKLLMMSQSLISLVVVAVLAARAINIL